MGNQVGTPRKLLIDGPSYDVRADNDSTKKPKTEKEGIATSGPTYQKITKVPEQHESVTITTTPEQNKQIEDIADSGAVVPISYTLADGTVWRCNGFIISEGRSSAEGTTTITMVAETEWTPFF